ncbi:MAG: hypothetical protein E5V65_03240 [Mesorhizobium sp.]|nr:MAG: hypothetical protein E5W06_05210 [Mesorhizobium sp.]TIW22710.1 MAG: hypothetical protein E5V65_03240 [Mesorhizobium sp.]
MTPPIVPAGSTLTLRKARGAGVFRKSRCEPVRIDEAYLKIRATGALFTRSSKSDTLSGFVASTAMAYGLISHRKIPKVFHDNIKVSARALIAHLA